MPRGYLKHSTQVSRKSARGGGSRRSTRGGDQQDEAWRARGGQKQHLTEIAELEEAEFWDGYYTDTNCEDLSDDYGSQEEQEDTEAEAHPDTQICSSEGEQEDTGEDAEAEAQPDTHIFPVSKKRNGSRKRHTDQIQDCPICFESRPVVHLNEVCHWHDAACLECMRCVYVTQAQKSSRNYPMRCFHPLCRKPIRETQLLKHGLIKTEKELKEHYRLTELGKGQQPGWCSVLCSYCDHARAYKHKENGPNRVFSCVECNENFMVSPFAEIIRAMVDYGEISDSSDWAQCPECKMLVTRGYSDDDTVCVCGAHFSWAHAQRQSGFRYPFGKPANHGVNDFLYLYW